MSFQTVTPREITATRTSLCTPIETVLSMSLYGDKDDIDWDADLFGQIGRRAISKESTSNGAGWDEWDNLDNDKSRTRAFKSSTTTSSSVDSLRRQMKEAWSTSTDNNDANKEEETKEGVKPSADWVPNFRKGPDEDEPWFTG